MREPGLIFFLALVRVAAKIYFVRRHVPDALAAAPGVSGLVETQMNGLRIGKIRGARSLSVKVRVGRKR
jgi:hypothetical protein